MLCCFLDTEGELKNNNKKHQRQQTSVPAQNVTIGVWFSVCKTLQNSAAGWLISCVFSLNTKVNNTDANSYLRNRQLNRITATAASLSCWTWSKPFGHWQFSHKECEEWPNFELHICFRWNDKGGLVLRQCKCKKKKIDTRNSKTKKPNGNNNLNEN